jgi:hypothetical protein
VCVCVCVYVYVYKAKETNTRKEMAKHHPDLVFCRKQPGIGSVAWNAAVCRAKAHVSCAHMGHARMRAMGHARMIFLGALISRSCCMWVQQSAACARNVSGLQWALHSDH